MADHDERDLRRELASFTRGPGKRYPREIRLRGAAWARREIEAGRGTKSLARYLGVHPETLKAWIEDAAAISAVIPVEVIEATAASASAHVSDAAKAVSVTTPDGFRVDGLTLDEVVTLLARLR